MEGESSALTKSSLGLALLVVLSFTLADAGADVASGSASSGRIVFQSSRDGDYDIYAMNPDGTGLTELTHNDFEDSSPFPSPDGNIDRLPFRGRLHADQRRTVAAGACSKGAGEPTRPGLRTRPGSYAKSRSTTTQVSRSSTSLPARPGFLPGGGKQPAGRRTGARSRTWTEVSTSSRPRAARADGSAAAGSTRSARPLGRRIRGGSPTPGSTGSSYRVDLFTIRADGSGERRLVQRIAGAGCRFIGPRRAR